MSEIKVILVGESNTGKTSIIKAVMGRGFESNECSTLGASYESKTMKLNDKEYTLSIWDTVGQEKFRSLTKIFLKDSKIVIIVYSITNKNSFKEIDFWYETIKSNLGDKIVLGLAGNKKDLFQEEEITEEEGEEKAKEIGALFKLTSAKTGLGIEDFFKILLEEYVNKNGIGNINDNGKGAKLKAGNNKSKNQCKC